MDEKSTMRMLGTIDALEYLAVMSIVGMASQKEDPVAAINRTIDLMRRLAAEPDAPFSGDPVRAALSEARDAAFSRMSEKAMAMLFAGSPKGRA